MSGKFYEIQHLIVSCRR